MIRGLRLMFGAAVLTSAAAFAVTACKTATQVTVDVSLLPNTMCAQTNGTAIVAARDTTGAESNVTNGYLSAVTTSCDDGTKDIGTLVVTPGDSDRGAVIVVVSFSRQHDATACKPPLYTDCVVARRSFAFVDHTKLTLPIEIDFDCVNVPCDSKSTCKHGQCYSSEVELTPGSDRFEPAGVQADGATEDAVVPDAGSDASPVDEAGNKLPYCVGTQNPALYCPTAKCIAPGRCSLVGGLATCGSQVVMGAQYCCTDGDCSGTTPVCKNARPSATPSAPGECSAPTTPPLPYCAGSTLHCHDSVSNADTACASPNECCGPTAQCGMSTCPSARHCCTSNDCGGALCMGASGSTPGTCATASPSPSCDGGVLECPTTSCVTGFCCTNGASASCMGSCGAAPLCCTNNDCGPDTCMGGTVLFGAPHTCGAGGDAGNEGGGGGMGAACVNGGSQLVCGMPQVNCSKPMSCCGTMPANATCGGSPFCPMFEMRWCCNTSDCDGGTCSAAGSLGHCQ